MNGKLLSEDLIESILDKVSRKKRVRLKLAGNGRISLERPLPYVLVYRFPPDRNDAGTIKLVLGESSYIVAPRENYDHKLFVHLIKKLAKHSVKEYGSFLIIEIWSGNTAENKFILKGPEKGAESTIETFKKEFKNIQNIYPEAEIAVDHTNQRHPEGFAALMSAHELKELGCLLTGIEVPNIFTNPKTGELYPVFFRTLRSRFSSVLRKAIYNFIRVQTTFDIEHYYVLGRTTIDRAVWHIDARLAEIEQSYEFLLLVSPINSEKAWWKYKKDNFEKEPQFHYRLLPVDPDILKKKLYKLNIHKVDDPALTFLFRDKRDELDKQITLLDERGTRDFLYTSIRLYKGVEEDLLKVAEGILAAVPPEEPSKGTKDIFTGSRYVDAQGFKRKAEEEFSHYKSIFPPFNSKIQVRNDLTGLMVSQGNLYIPKSLKLDPDRVDALIHHEVGTHVLTYCNGKAQPLKQLYCGLADYDELQEGLAVLAEYLSGGLNRDRMRLLAARVVCAHDIIDGASFIEAFRKLRTQYGFRGKTAFGVTTRTYQGGGFIKDVIYLRGLVKLMHHLREGGALEPLFIGKIAEKHIPIINELRQRGILRPIPLLPRYLNTERAQERLELVRNGLMVTSLIEKEVA